jgi:hypothetical protein
MAFVFRYSPDGPYALYSAVFRVVAGLPLRYRRHGPAACGSLTLFLADFSFAGLVVTAPHLFQAG